MNSKKNTFYLGFLLLLVSLPVIEAQKEGSHGEEVPSIKETDEKEVAFKGEILDLICYMKKGEKPKCSASCLRKGAQAGLKDENGKIYLLTPNKKKTNVDMLSAHAGRNVTVKGHLIRREGIELIKDAYIEIKRPKSSN